MSNWTNICLMKKSINVYSFINSYFNMIWNIFTNVFNFKSLPRSYTHIYSFIHICSISLRSYKFCQDLLNKGSPFCSQYFPMFSFHKFISVKTPIGVSWSRQDQQSADVHLSLSVVSLLIKTVGTRFRFQFQQPFQLYVLHF